MGTDPIIPIHVAKWCWLLYIVFSSVLSYSARDIDPLAPYQWWIGLSVAVLGAVLGVSTPHLVSRRTTT